MVFVAFLVTALAGYLLGSIPSGYLAGKARGVDIRTAGSGNIGATNAFRILGRGLGTCVLLADACKGWLAVALLPGLAQRLTGVDAPVNVESLRILAAVAVVLGHNYTCWLRFKGGKGIATSAGVLAALMPLALVISLTVWLLVCALTRFVSVASLAAALVLPFGAWLGHSGGALTGVAVALSALAIYKHKANIQRLLAGTENRIGGPRRPPANAEAEQ